MSSQRRLYQKSLLIYNKNVSIFDNPKFISLQALMGRGIEKAEHAG